MSHIRSSRDFDYVLIESNGIAEPQAVAQAFVYDPATAELATSEASMLWKQARLDTCVTVIDAHSFANHMSTLQQLFGDKYNDGLDHSTPEGHQEGEQSISDLLIEHVVFAIIILLNKTDLLSDEERAETEKIIRSLNPMAKIDTANGDDEYGITYFVYRARTPFHPNRIGGWMESILHCPTEWKHLDQDQRKSKSDPKRELVQEHYGNMHRAKGFCWLAYHDSFMLGISQSGCIGMLHPIMPWLSVIPKEQWGVQEEYAIIHSKFVDPHGDRLQEIIFIGTNLKVDIFKQQLDTCLLTEDESKSYNVYNDQRGFGK